MNEEQKEKNRNYLKDYYEVNKEHIKAYSKAYKEINRDIVKESNRLYKGKIKKLLKPNIWNVLFAIVENSIRQIINPLI